MTPCWAAPLALGSSLSQRLSLAHPAHGYLWQSAHRGHQVAMCAANLGIPPMHPYPSAAQGTPWHRLAASVTWVHETLVYAVMHQVNVRYLCQPQLRILPIPLNVQLAPQLLLAILSP